MHDFLHNVGQVIVALWQLGRRRNWAPRAWDFYALWVSRLTRLALIVVVCQPIAVILASLTGVHELTVLVALTPVVALLFLVVVASLPRYQNELATALTIGVVASAWDRTAKILGAIIRGLLLFLLLDLAFGLYFSLLPVEEDRWLILWIVLFGVILLTSVALLPPGWRKALTNTVVIGGFIVSVVVLAVVIPLVLANGGRDETRRDIARAFEDDAKAAPAEAVGEPVRFRIKLRGLDSEVPAVGKRICWFYNTTFVGPADEAPLVLYVFEDGSEVPVFDSSGNRLPALNKSLRGFKGPEGRALAVAVTPPKPGEGTEDCREYLKRQGY